MFDPTKEVPNLELCKKLKELGYPQKSGGWYWIRYINDTLLVFSYNGDIFFLDTGNIWVRPEIIAKAPTVAELGEWLPAYGMAANRTSSGWVVYDNTFEERFNDFQVEANTEANARAKMLIWLVENGHVKFNKVV